MRSSDGEKREAGEGSRAPGPAFGQQTDADSFLEPVLTSDWFRYLPDARDNPSAAADRAFGPEAVGAVRSA